MRVSFSFNNKSYQIPVDSGESLHVAIQDGVQQIEINLQGASLTVFSIFTLLSILEQVGGTLKYDEIGTIVVNPPELFTYHNPLQTYEWTNLSIITVSHFQILIT